MYRRHSNGCTHQHERYSFGKIVFGIRVRQIAFSNRNLIPSQRKVLEAIQDELSYGKGREITTIQAIYDRLGISLVLFLFNLSFGLLAF